MTAAGKGPAQGSVAAPRWYFGWNIVAAATLLTLLTVGALEACIRRGSKGLLKEISLFDVYTGVGIAPGKKSVAFNLAFRAEDRSLTAAEADAEVTGILALLKSELDAALR